MNYYKTVNGGKTISVMSCTAPQSETETLIAVEKAEYLVFVALCKQKQALVNRLYTEEITIDDVPEEWREEIRRRVSDLIASNTDSDEDEISDEMFMEMLEGVL